MADRKKLLGGLDAIGKRLLASRESEEGGLNAIRSAGRVAHEQEAAMRAAKNAEVADQMARLPARNKKANEALGLYHPVGGGIKLSKPTSGMHATTVADPKFNPPDIGIITPEQLVKEEAALFPLVGDRAAAGRYLTHVGENELETPVRLTGGARYMDANYNHLNPEESAAWESGVGRTTALGKQAGRAGEGGRPVYGIYTAGSGTNTDFNVMGANALYQQIAHGKITKKAEREFDQAMRMGTKEFPPLPNWPGIRSPEAQEMLLDKSNGIARTKLFGVMGKENFQSMGFPDVPATRKAIIEPELLDVPTNEAGFRLARMDATGRIIENPNIPSDYPSAMAGQVAGKLDVPMDYKDVFQSHFDARRLLSQPESGDYYSFSRAHPIQYADDEWLNRLMEKRLANERKIKEGEYKKGGTVDIEAADRRLAKAIEAHMAKGGGVDIEAADARLAKAIEQHMAGGGGAFKKLEFMADGGGAFKKIQFMDKGGKVGKVASGIANIGKRLMADDVLPTAEREANLAKFLSTSQEKRRLYHATPADFKEFQGKGFDPTISGNATWLTANKEKQPAAHNVSSRTEVYREGANVMPVHIQAERPMVLDNEVMEDWARAAYANGSPEFPFLLAPEWLKKVKEDGYDSIFHPRSGEIIMLEPNKIKSAIGNRGTYDISDPDITKAEGGGAFKKLEWQEPQHFDGGGMAVDLSDSEPLFTKKELETMKRNAPAVYEWAKQNVKDEANQLKTAKGMKDFGLRVGAQYAGAIPDLVNLGLMVPDALFQTKMSSEKPWFGSEQIIDAMHNAGMLGENEFPISETVAGVLAPAGLIKKGGKKAYQALENLATKTPKKRLGGLTAMSR